MWFSDIKLESYKKQEFDGRLLWEDYIDEGVINLFKIKKLF